MEDHSELPDTERQLHPEDLSPMKPGYKQQSKAMNSVATITDIKRLVHSHVSDFSRRHPVIPDRYVMPWKQDMVNRKLILRHADLTGVYRGPHEESLFLSNKERLCHGEDRHLIMEKMAIPAQIQNLPLHSPLSRYQSYINNLTSRRLEPHY
ncbi:sperm-associated microtubule inner protein 10 [Gastrophryne carolinensis]